MQGPAGSSPPEMEEHGIIEPLGDDDVPEAAREVTSDYEPSDEETTFGSVTSSVGDHVWEYGRSVSSPDPLTECRANPAPDATTPSATGDTPSPTTRRNTSASPCAT